MKFMPLLFVSSFYIVFNFWPPVLEVLFRTLSGCHTVSFADTQKRMQYPELIIIKVDSSLHACVDPFVMNVSINYCYNLDNPDDSILIPFYYRSILFLSSSPSFL